MKSNVVRATGLGAMFAAAMAIGQVTAPNEASAQVIERGVQGGIAGAIIGGIIGGGRGAGRGAAIGAGVGVVTGAMERDNLQRAYAYGGAPYGGGNLVYDTQVGLYRLGYDPGPPDGVFGRRTADAIAQYQYSNRLPVTGRPSPALLDHMARYGG
ncbi:MAG TPA: peptidoglycan-binding domain-containing protein [Methyloceanibacter sp.]|nr:peptidoglycan-binding domain-containing protein [Methyloceanibacter sp.]